MTILSIKIEKIPSTDLRRKKVFDEYRQIQKAITDSEIDVKPITELLVKLKEINLDLWNVEDDIRKLLNSGVGWMSADTTAFVSLAIKVPKLNDERSKIKNQINKLTNSQIVEVKSYTGFELGE